MFLHILKCSQLCLMFLNMPWCIIHCSNLPTDSTIILSKTKPRVTISSRIFIIYMIQIITFNMNPKITFVRTNWVFFITSGLNTYATWKSYYHKEEISVIYVGLFWQTNSCLQVTGFKSYYWYSVCFAEGLPLFSE